jgi:phosphoribosylformimino-5-aminoimidazole carboxamide ribotide isomerase
MRNLLVIPSIDIKNQKTVRVVQGIPELDCKEYGSDPVEMARIWRAENAKMLHIVDFDGAFEHSHVNFKTVEKICSSIVIPVQFAGGIRNMDDADLIMETGICRLSISTMALENPAEFEKVFEKYGPSKIVVSIDVVDNEVVTRGRKNKSGLHYNHFTQKMKSMGVERFIVTDVSKNGVLGGPNIEMSKDIALRTKCKVTLSGGIRNKDELIDIQQLMPAGIDSVIVGRALYENRFPCQKLWRVAESGIFR